MEDITESPRLLNPIDRAAEVLFGLIMALSFTCSISIANSHRTEIRQLLVGAIGCNLAWGLVDAAMFLIGILAQNSRNKIIFDSIQKSSDIEKARRNIAQTLPPVVASVLEKEELDQIRNRMMKLPGVSGSVYLTGNDIKKAIALFILVVISTFPVVVPFVVMHDTMLALRVSNFVAIIMMFLCGWSVAKYAGLSKWKMSTAITLIGIMLVAITIALGG